MGHSVVPELARPLAKIHIIRCEHLDVLSTLNRTPATAIREFRTALGRIGLASAMEPKCTSKGRHGKLSALSLSQIDVSDLYFKDLTLI